MIKVNKTTNAACQLNITCTFWTYSKLHRLIEPHMHVPHWLAKLIKGYWFLRFHQILHLCLCPGEILLGWKPMSNVPNFQMYFQMEFTFWEPFKIIFHQWMWAFNNITFKLNAHIYCINNQFEPIICIGKNTLPCNIKAATSNRYLPMVNTFAVLGDSFLVVTSSG